MIYGEVLECPILLPLFFTKQKYLLERIELHNNFAAHARFLSTKNSNPIKSNHFLKIDC